MAKPRKVIRTKNLYKKQLIPPKILGVITFVSLIVVITAIGFVLMHEMTTRFGDNDINVDIDDDININNNSLVEEVVPPIQDVIPTEDAIPETVDVSKIAFIDSNTIILGKTAIENKINEFIDDEFDSIAFELKPVTGKLSYNTEVTQAVKYKAIELENSLLSLNEIVKISKENEITPVAYLSTLQDATAHVQYSTGYAYSTYTTTNWLDNSVDAGGKSWLNPYMENTQNYIIDLVSECYDAGFEIVFLDNVIFPTQNTDKMNTLKTTPSKEQILNDFVSLIEKAVPEVTIFRVEDLTFTASIDDVKGKDIDTINYNTVLSRCDTANIAVSISLDNISKRKEQIILREDLKVENKSDNVEIFKLLLEKTIDSLNEDVTVVVTQKDFQEISSVLDELNVVNFIVK